MRPRGQTRKDRRMSERMTIPMTPEMLRAVRTEGEARNLPAAEWVRRLIDQALGAQAGEAA